MAQTISRTTDRGATVTSSAHSRLPDPSFSPPAYAGNSSELAEPLTPDIQAANPLQGAKRQGTSYNTEAVDFHLLLPSSLPSRRTRQTNIMRSFCVPT